MGDDGESVLRSRSHRCGPVLWILLLANLCGPVFTPLIAQTSLPRGIGPGIVPPRSSSADLSLGPSQVDVHPVAKDEQIRKRLQSVMEATNWFRNPAVHVDQGVVFLRGTTSTPELKKWAGDLARNTQDVVAVVNQIEVVQPSAWDLQPAWSGLQQLWRDSIRVLPFVLFGLFILALSFGVGMLATRVARRFLRDRIAGVLIRNVLARATGVLVFLLGTYIVLRISGLTQLALTVIGSTGLAGLAIGIAFRDITENFLASIFLSMQQPFATGDLVEITGVTGYVQQLNVRTTVLMTLDGNLVQIPNATVYKSNLRNFTTNANRRADFAVGIGYDDSIEHAQEVARNILTEHPAILSDPEPSVLVEELGKATVNLRLYFWINGREHSWMKVRSSVIRLVKAAFQKQGISMPDEARGVVFPEGIPISLIGGQIEMSPGVEPAARLAAARPASQAEEVSTKSEGDLSSEAGVIEEQASNVRPLRNEENLLKNPS
jgi:small conductance mechanosensitive channel